MIPLYSVKHPVGRLDVDRLRADAEVITLPPFAAGELPEAVITEAGLSISPIRRVASEEAELLARRLTGAGRLNHQFGPALLGEIPSTHCPVTIGEVAQDPVHCSRRGGKR